MVTAEHKPTENSFHSQPTGADGLFSIWVLIGTNHLYVSDPPNDFDFDETGQKLEIANETPPLLTFDLHKKKG